MSDDPNLSEMKCLEHAGLFVWTLPVYDWLEVRAGSSRDDAHGEQTEKEIQAGIIEEFMDPVLGKDGPHFWEEVSFELENKSALLPHIENRFPTEEGGHDSTEARRIRLTDAGRRELGGSCLMYWKGYRSPGNGKPSLPDFVRVMNAEVIFLPDATAMCVLELTVGKLSEEEEQSRPKVGTRLGQDKTGSKGADKTLPLEDLESVFCKTRRALVEGKTYVGPLHEQPQTPQVHSSEFPEHAKTLTELLNRVHGNAAGTDDDTPACNPFRLTELRDGLFGALCGAGSEITDWSRPMLYTMVRLTDPGTTGCSGATDAHGAGESRSSAWLTRIRTLSFRIANGFGARYPMSETADGLAVGIPLANRWFAASRSGAVTLCFDNGHDFHKQYMRRLRRDYFLIYLVALHQRHCLHELNDKTARLLTREELRQGEPDPQKIRKLKLLRSAMQEFLTHTRARHVSDYVLHAEAYGCFWDALDLDSLYRSADESIRELNDFLDRRREEREKARETRKKRIIDALLILGLPITFASTLFGLNLEEYEESLGRFSNPNVLAGLGFCVVLALVVASIIHKYSNRTED